MIEHLFLAKHLLFTEPKFSNEQYGQVENVGFVRGHIRRLRSGRLTSVRPHGRMPKGLGLKRFKYSFILPKSFYKRYRAKYY